MVRQVDLSTGQVGLRHRALLGRPHGPLMAKTRPGPDWMQANSVLPSGLNTGPVNSLLFWSLRASV